MKIKYNTNSEGDLDYSGVILCENKFGSEFEVPLWDVRDGEVARYKAEIMEKLGNAARGSKYIPNTDKFK